MESTQTSEFRPLILVAEDDDSNFKLIKAIIGKKCDIMWARNGEEMVNLFQTHGENAKAMLMDIKMPLMNLFHRHCEVCPVVGRCRNPARQYRSTEGRDSKRGGG